MMKEIQERAIEEIIQLETKLFQLYLNSVLFSSLLSGGYFILSIIAFHQEKVFLGTMEFGFFLLFGYLALESKKKLDKHFNVIIREQYRLLIGQNELK